MAFEISTQGKFTVVHIDEVRFDASQVDAFKTFMFEHIEGGATELVIDLSMIRFMDSSGLGVLVSVLKKMDGNGSLVLAGAQAAIQDLFSLTAMDRLFSIVDSVDQATAG